MSNTEVVLTPPEHFAVLVPERGWMHMGCKRCGRVHMWPEERREEPVWCTHGDGRVVWGVLVDEAATGWTRIVPVHVWVAP